MTIEKKSVYLLLFRLKLCAEYFEIFCRDFWEKVVDIAFLYGSIDKPSVRIIRKKKR